MNHTAKVFRIQASRGPLWDADGVSQQTRSDAVIEGVAERHLLALAEHVSDIVYVAGADRLIRWISPYVENVLGWHPTELIGVSLNELLHPEDRPRVAAERDRMYATARKNSPDGGVEMRLRAKSGEYRWFSGRGVSLSDEHGNPDGLAAGLRDVDDLVHERERARSSEQHVRMILDAMLDPQVMLEAVRAPSGAVVDLQFAAVNSMTCAVLGSAAQDLVGQRVLQRMPGVASTDLWRKGLEVLETGRPLVWDDYRFPDDVLPQERYYDIRAVRLDDSLSCLFRDVTERHNAARVVAESERRFRLLAENTSDVVITVRRDGMIDWISPAARAALGRSVESLLGTRFTDLVHPRDVAELGSPQAEVRLGSDTRGWRWMRIGTRVLNGTGSLTIHTAQDIQAEMDARTKLAHELGHDPLTGLTNRTQTLVRLTDELRRPATRARLALLAVGMDDLRSVNEAFTYAAGDMVLKQIGTRLLAFAKYPDDVARVGDNEFTLLVRAVEDAAELAELATVMQEDLSSAIVIDSHKIDVTVSIGIATPEGPEALELLRDATSAMHHARLQGGNRWEYLDTALADAARERLIMRSGIRDALLADEFRAWFQPVVAMADGSVIAYEALARWHRDSGIVQPAQFVPVAESTELIIALDRVILRQAMAAVAALDGNAHLAVNVSAATLSTPDLAESLQRELGRTGLDPARLQLEVTETALLSPTGSVRQGMREVADLGVTWWVDDFGTGYSSIAHLRDLPVQGLKLDRSFTAGLATDPTCVRLAQGLVGLAHGLGMGTIAEGVETAEQAAILAGQGWEMGQGWLYGQPQQAMD
jgi:diguanylate cyclase (GGDEF)-like protein/PAS domain S-box-containing protein